MVTFLFDRRSWWSTASGKFHGGAKHKRADKDAFEEPRRWRCCSRHQPATFDGIGSSEGFAGAEGTTESVCEAGQGGEAERTEETASRAAAERVVDGLDFMQADKRGERSYRALGLSPGIKKKESVGSRYASW